MLLAAAPSAAAKIAIVMTSSLLPKDVNVPRRPEGGLVDGWHRAVT